MFYADNFQQIYNWAKITDQHEISDDGMRCHNILSTIYGEYISTKTFVTT